MLFQLPPNSTLNNTMHRFITFLFSFPFLSRNDLINNLLNSFVPHIATQALLSFIPCYLFLKFLCYVYRSVFSENIAEKVVLIAGASSGMGEHLAYEYARRGAYLALAARRFNSLKEVADRALDLGSPGVITIQTDVSKAEDCERLIEETIKYFGLLDHLVLCAAETPVCLFEEVENATNLAPVMDINFWGYVYTTKFVIPHLKRSKGKIIVIASLAAWLYAPRLGFYNASKAAVVSFYETLRVELGSNVGITIVTPGLVESEMTKGKFLTSEGRLVVDQDLRDVELSIIPVETVQTYVKSVVNSACRGDKYLTEPSWYRVAFYWKMFWPESLEWLNRWFLAPIPGIPPSQVPSKKILDITGLKHFIYPPSLLSPEIKKD